MARFLPLKESIITLYLNLSKIIAIIYLLNQMTVLYAQRDKIVIAKRDVTDRAQGADSRCDLTIHGSL
jgi:hypothetical protein